MKGQGEDQDNFKEVATDALTEPPKMGGVCSNGSGGLRLRAHRHVKCLHIASV